MKACFYVSGHGFGHASRTTQIINEVARIAPDCAILIRTSVPRWFLESSLRTTVAISTRETDVGVAQADSLSIDPDQTARRAAAFYRDFDERVDREAHDLRAAGVTLVVGDVPPLAFAAAARAGLPSIAVANFTWDWIYEAYPQFDADAPGVIPLIRDAYSRATLGLRLPFAGGFDTVARVVDVPLVARTAPLTRGDARRRLQVDDTGRPVVLASFGGHGIRLPVASALRERSFTLMLTGEECDVEAGSHPDLRLLTPAGLATLGLTYPDLVAASDVVLSKSGYGIVSECIANGTALMYASRGHFVEHEVFARELPRVLRSRAIDREDLLAGRWSAGLHALLEQPEPPERMRTDGASVAAQHIVSALTR